MFALCLTWSLTCFVICVSFDLQLEKFGVDIKELKQPATTRIFRAWVEDWEKDLLKMNDCVAEARILEKYRGLVFWDPDTEANFTVHEDNLEFHRGKDGGWHLIGNSSDESVEDEGFAIGEMIIGMIADTEQRSGVEIICEEEVELTELADDVWANEEVEEELDRSC